MTKTSRLVSSLKDNNNTTTMSVAGSYIYKKPGNLDTWEQKLTVRSDGTGDYWECIDTKTETVTRSGSGTWSVDKSDGEFMLQCKMLKKVTKAKGMVMIPSLANSVKEDPNVVVGIKSKDLIDAPDVSTDLKNKWLRV
jgi:hypothetical protein